MQKKLKNYSLNGLTHVGHVRQHNEDNILIDLDLGLLLVADGMGGHQAGEIASHECIQVIKKMLTVQQRDKPNPAWFSRLFLKKNKKAELINLNQKKIENALREANHHVYQLNVERNLSSGTGMGTTVAGCLLIDPTLMLIFHIGDSRIYRYRNQKLEALSKDHSILQEWQDQGGIGEKPQSNIIIRAVGPFEETEAVIQAIQIESKDTFMICSDGLTDMVDDEDIAEALHGVEAKQVESFCHKLLNLALERGGKDNVSIILMSHQ